MENKVETVVKKKEDKKIEYRIGRETFLGIVNHKEYLIRHFTVFMDKSK